jgi:hypothetical protein
LAFIHLIELTYGIGAALAIAVLPLYLIQRLFRRSRMLTAAFDPVERAPLLSNWGRTIRGARNSSAGSRACLATSSSRDHLS